MKHISVGVAPVALPHLLWVLFTLLHTPRIAYYVTHKDSLTNYMLHTTDQYLGVHTYILDQSISIIKHSKVCTTLVNYIRCGWVGVLLYGRGLGVGGCMGLRMVKEKVVWKLGGGGIIREGTLSVIISFFIDLALDMFTRKNFIDPPLSIGLSYKEVNCGLGHAY